MKYSFILILILTALIAPLAASAGITPYTTNSGSLIPLCDPALTPNQGGACGLAKFTQLLANIIGFLNMVMIPLAGCMIAYAGFILLTSGGNAERVSKAHGMIKIAVIGVIILLGSYILVQFVFNALNVKDTIDGAPTIS